jgi:hypothetical protein
MEDWNDFESRLSEQDFRHHALVFVLWQMAIKERHDANDWIGKIHNATHKGMFSPSLEIELI